MKENKKSATEIIRYMKKLRKQGEEQFLWGALSLQMGHTRLGLPDIARTKQEFSHITNADELAELWIGLGDNIAAEFKKIYKKDLRLEK